MRLRGENQNQHETPSKHTKLTRPSIGHFHRNEFAILGTPCSEIKELSRRLIQALGADYNIAYVDADHKNADDESQNGKDLSSALTHGANMEFTDKITFSRFDMNRSFNSFEQKPWYQSQDAVLVNGNHFLAKWQIAVIDSRKPLEKKLPKLTEVKLILLQEGMTEIPGYLTAHLPDVNDIPVLRFDETEKIAAFLQHNIRERIAPLKGLILAGGSSQRMGKDKAVLEYHNKPQYAHLIDVFSELHIPVSISCREDQKDKFIGKRFDNRHFHRPWAVWCNSICFPGRS